MWGNNTLAPLFAPILTMWRCCSTTYYLSQR